MSKKLVALCIAGGIGLTGVGLGTGIAIGNNNKAEITEDIKAQIIEVNEDVVARLTKDTKEYIKEVTGLELDIDNSSWDATATVEKKGGKEYTYAISGTAKDKKYCEEVNASLTAYSEGKTDEQLLDYMKKVLSMVKNSKDVKAEQVNELIESLDVTVSTVAKTMIGEYNANQEFKKVDEITNIITDKEVKDDDLKAKNTIVGVERLDSAVADESLFDVYAASTFKGKVFTVNYKVTINSNAPTSAVKDIIQKYLNDGLVDEGVTVEYKNSIVEDMSLTPSIFQTVNNMEKEASVQAGA